MSSSKHPLSLSYLEILNQYFKVGDVISEDYAVTNEIRAQLDLMSKNDPYSFTYIINYTSGIYEYISPNVTKLLGLSQADVLAKGMDLVSSIMLKEDIGLLQNYWANATRFIFERSNKTASGALKSKFIDKTIILSVFLRFRATDGQVKWFKQTNSFILNWEGKYVMDFGVVTEIREVNRRKLGYQIEIASPDGIEIVESEFQYKGAEDCPLTIRQLDVLKAIVKGGTMKEIAARLSVSIYTIYEHRKQICKKMSASTFSEAVSKATDLGWLEL